MPQNLFIAFEGIDGSGKSTQVKLLSEALKKAGHKIYTTFEPTDSPIGSVIRNILQHRIDADDRTIAGLFVADRLDHLLNKTNGILKKMEEGFSVITDRYYFSSYAYHGTHMPIEWVIQANALSQQLLKPDVTVYIDILPEVSMNRISAGRNSMDLYETEGNLKKVREKYFEAFDLLSGHENVLKIDGNRPPSDIAKDIFNEISKLYVPAIV